LPIAATVNVAGSPTTIVCESGRVVMAGGARPITTWAMGLVTLPTGVVAVTGYAPESATRTVASVSVGEGAPGIGTPSLFHCRVNGPLPAAVAPSTTVSNSTVVTPTGGVVMLGGTRPRVTLRFLNVIALAKAALATRQPK